MEKREKPLAPEKPTRFDQKIDFDILSHALSREGGYYLRIPIDVVRYFGIGSRDLIWARIKFRRPAEEDESNDSG